MTDQINRRQCFLTYFMICLGSWMSACELEVIHLKEVSKVVQTNISSDRSNKQNEKSCDPRCQGHMIINDQCDVGDCSIFGTTCIADPTPRCGTPECPRDGEATICLDEYQILDCQDGLLTALPGDCSAYGARCSTAGVRETEARCVSSLCYNRDEVPYDREICSLNQGFKIACYADSTLENLPCPAGEICRFHEGVAECVFPITGCEGPSRAGQIIDHYLCLEGAVSRCYNGNIISEQHCDVSEECYDQHDLVRCVESVCIGNNGILNEGVICRGQRELIECDTEGVVISSMLCGSGERCDVISGQFQCVPEVLEQRGGEEAEEVGGEEAEEVGGGEAEVLVGGDALEMSIEESMEMDGGRIVPEITYQDEENDDDDSFLIQHTCAQMRSFPRELTALLMFMIGLRLWLRVQN